MPSTAPLRILLLTASELDYVVTRRLLEALGPDRHHLTWCEDEDLGLGAIARRGPDLVLLGGSEVPGGTAKLLERIATEHPGLPVVLLTDGGDGVDDGEALALGAGGLVDRTRVAPRDLARAMDLALERGRTLRELRERNEELLGLHRLTLVALEQPEEGRFLERAARELAERTGFGIVCIEVHDAARDRLVCLAVSGLDGCVVGRSEPLAESPVGDAVRHGRPLLEMGLGEPVAPFHGARVGTWIALPLREGPQVVAVVTLARTDRGPVDSAQVHRVTGLVEHVGRLWRRRGERFRVPASPPCPTAPDSGPRRSLEEQLAPLLSGLRRELHVRGLRLQVRGLGGTWTPAPATAARLRRSVALVLGALLRALGPGRVEVRVRPAGDADAVLPIEVSAEGPAPGPRRAGLLGHLRRLARSQGVALELDGSRAGHLEARLAFPLGGGDARAQLGS